MIKIFNLDELKQFSYSMKENKSIKQAYQIHFTSIIVLTYNNLEYTKLCIESIRKFTPKDCYELIIIDNNSTDGTVEWLKEQNNINVIYNRQNLGFPKGCNQGIEIANGENILLLNNDTIVTPNWLYNLDNVIWSDSNIGVVGCVSNKVPNNQQIVTNYFDVTTMIKFALSYNKIDFSKHEERDLLIGFCLMIKSDIVKKVGLLDERFSPGNYEDNDYCLRIMHLGYKLILCKDTFIHHFGNISFGKYHTEYLNLLKINEEKFNKKWNIQ